MKFKILFFSLLTFLILFALSIAATNGNVTIRLNSSTAFWNDPIRAEGTARYSNGDPIANAKVAITVDREIACPDSDSEGNWHCDFNSPNELGDYVVYVEITNSNGSKFTNSTSLSVKIRYGARPKEATDRVVYEVPLLIQDVSGRIRRIWARVAVWE